MPCETDLFRRMLFNCFVHNTDDHLRNHGFVRSSTVWRLSPAFDLTVHRKARLVLQPAEGVSPAPNPVSAFAAYPAFNLDRRAAVTIYEEVAEGMLSARAALDAQGVSLSDRDVIGARWASVFSPPAVSSLPISELVRPPSTPRGDPLKRLEELRIEVNLATHEIKRTGHSIAVLRKETGQLDNVPGMPARIRNAWSTSPLLEFFEDGKAVPPPTAGVRP